MPETTLGFLSPGSLRFGAAPSAFNKTRTLSLQSRSCRLLARSPHLKHVILLH